MTISDRNTKAAPGERFVAFYKGTKYVTEAKAGEGDKVVFIVKSPKEYQGPTAEGRYSGGANKKTFGSLDALAMAIYHPHKRPGCLAVLDSGVRVDEGHGS